MYVGRFAPTPSGPLHFGSMVTAVGSFCDAKSQSGKWLIRIDDLDHERKVEGADTEIFRVLESFSPTWDDEPIYQSQQRQYYEDWLTEFGVKIDCYPCVCSRKVLRQRSIQVNEEWVYNGYCRTHPIINGTIRNYRIKLNNPSITSINDTALGSVSQDLHALYGDFVVFKSDGTPSYHLASVLDDHNAGVTDIVRGRDLLSSSLRQAAIQKILGYPTQNFLHIPLVRNEKGQKLSKQNKARPINTEHVTETLIKVLHFLSQDPPRELCDATSTEILSWAVHHWNPLLTATDNP